MSQPAKSLKRLETPEQIVISSTVQEPLAPVKICWNTGEEKNCTACYLREGCKAKE